MSVQKLFTIRLFFAFNTESFKLDYDADDFFTRYFSEHPVSKRSYLEFEAAKVPDPLLIVRFFSNDVQVWYASSIAIFSASVIIFIGSFFAVDYFCFKLSISSFIFLRFLRITDQIESLKRFSIDLKKYMFKKSSDNLRRRLFSLLPSPGLAGLGRLDLSFILGGKAAVPVKWKELRGGFMRYSLESHSEISVQRHSYKFFLWADFYNRRLLTFLVHLEAGYNCIRGFYWLTINLLVKSAQLVLKPAKSKSFHYFVTFGRPPFTPLTIFYDVIFFRSIRLRRYAIS
ncbi:hypothetical protein BDF21DRAFT_449212 [Thamnidium elegans]|nr:hypothetical protein BDF21DRAFT_449212 [Thamnidium elegans]